MNHVKRNQEELETRMIPKVLGWVSAIAIMLIWCSTKIAWAFNFDPTVLFAGKKQSNAFSIAGEIGIIPKRYKFNPDAARVEDK